MPWKAKLIDVRQAGGTADVTVTFYKSGREVTRTFNLHPEQFKTRKEFLDFVRDEAGKLDSFDVVGDSLKALIGTDIL